MEQKHVFISYVRENSDEVQRLCDDLTKHGVKVWLDKNEIKPGERWQDAIEEAIEEGNFFLACFSNEYNKRDENVMNKELTLAIDRLCKFSTNRIWFIPVLLSECKVPNRRIGGGERLHNLQWVELYKDWDVGIQRIVDVIQPTPPELQILMEALHSDNGHVRESAAEALGGYRDKRTVDALIEALDDYE